jgi:ATP phosphoribosyltransferase regulatory subunit
MRTETPPPRSVLAAIRAPFQAEEATLLDPPVVQPLNLFLDLAGEVMRARLFIVQAEGRQEACLRPDLTIPIARAHIAAGAATGRYAYEGKAFRATPHGGAGHAEEFLQIGLEAYQPAGIADEAHVAALAWRAASAGGREDLSLRLGDAALFAAFLSAIDVAGQVAGRLKRAFGRLDALEAELVRSQDGAARSSAGGELAALLGGLPEAQAAGLLDELWALAGIQPVGGRPATEIVHRLVARGDAAVAPKLSAGQADLIRRYVSVVDGVDAALDRIGELASEGLAAPIAAWRERLDALAAADVPTDRMSFAAGFGRAFGYYDGFLFDVLSTALGEWRPVAGGGRYDSLLLRLGAKASPGAIGCMVRPARAWKEGGE